MKWILTLTNEDINIVVNQPDIHSQEYEVLLHQVMKGDPGTTNYEELTNKPSINGVTLEGNKTAGDLGLVTGEYVDSEIARVEDEIPTKVSELENDAEYISEAPNDDNIYGRENRKWTKSAYEHDVEWGDF